MLLCRRVPGARGGGTGFDFCDFGLLSGFDEISWLLSLVRNDLFFSVFSVIQPFILSIAIVKSWLMD